MSIQALNWAMAQDDIKNSGTRFVLLILCNYANEAGECYPSRETIAKKTSMTPRSVQTHLNWLAENGYIAWKNQRNSSRQSSNLYQIRIERQANRQSEIFSPSEIGQSENISLSNASQSENFARQGENFDTSQGENISPNPKEEESLVDPKEKKKRATSKSEKVPDPRAVHPAIVAVRDLAKLFPPAAIWDTLIEELGPAPDVERLRACFVEWSTRGYKPNNFSWARDWYLHGVPNTPGHLGRPLRVNAAIPQLTVVPDAGIPVPAIERRPAADSLPEHRELWRAFRDQIRPQLPGQAFETWFSGVIFDGLDVANSRFLLRAEAHTHDWITSYYQQEIYDTLVAIGCPEFSLEWEIEGQEMEIAA